VPVATPQDLQRRFAKGPVPVVAAVGPEAYLREEVARGVAELVLGSAESPDVVTVQGEGGGAEEDRDAAQRFFDEARTMSMFGTGKVVVLRGAGALAKRVEKDFLAWLARPSRTCVAVLLADELPAKVEKAVEKAGLLVRCGGRGTRTEAPDRFAARRAAEHGKRLGRTEAGLLVEAVGAELSALEQAVEMLCLHAGEEPAVTAEAVAALFHGGREGTVWAFGDRLLEGEVAAALTQAGRCFQEGVAEDPKGARVTHDERRIATRLLLAFSMAVSRVVDVRRQLDRGVPRQEVSLAGPPAWRSAALRTATSRPAEAFEAMLLAAEETERAMKSGGPDGRLAIARLATGVGMVAARRPAQAPGRGGGPGPGRGPARSAPR